jgi:hypothetical protein
VHDAIARTALFVAHHRDQEKGLAREYRHSRIFRFLRDYDPLYQYYVHLRDHPEELQQAVGSREAPTLTDGAYLPRRCENTALRDSDRYHLTFRDDTNLVTIFRTFIRVI